jgi:hypothetical protein
MIKIKMYQCTGRRYLAWSAVVSIISRASLKKPLLHNIPKEWPKPFRDRQIRKYYKNLSNFMHRRGNRPDLIFSWNSAEATALIPFFQEFSRGNCPVPIFFQDFSRGNCPDSILSRNSVEETALIQFFPGIQSRKSP